MLELAELNVILGLPKSVEEANSTLTSGIGGGVLSIVMLKTGEKGLSLIATV